MVHPFIVGGCSEAKWNNLESRVKYLRDLRNDAFNTLFNDENGINVLYAMETLDNAFTMTAFANRRDSQWTEQTHNRMAKLMVKLVRDYLDRHWNAGDLFFVLDAEKMVLDVIWGLCGDDSDFHKKFADNLKKMYETYKNNEISNVRRNPLKQERIRRLLKMMMNSSYWETGELDGRLI
jgi:hypothetical protein